MQATTGIPHPAQKSSRADVRDTLTQKIIELMERGGLHAMQRWTQTAASIGRPLNASTRQPYQGGNVLFLWCASMAAGYASPLWLTFKQAREMGGQVRKGEHGTLCAYWNRIETKDSKKARAAATAAGGDAPDERDYLMCRPFYLFNVEQIDGLPEECYADAASREAQLAHPIDAADQLIAATHATIRYGGNRAYYRQSEDYVGMPKPEQFASPELFYATVQHELTHWTGHPCRLNRVKGKRFGDDAYAFEELVAELGAAFLAAEIGFVDATVEGHAQYLQSWLRVLKNDRSAIFTAARLAGEAADYLLACLAQGAQRKVA